VASVAPDLPLYDVTTLEQIVRDDLADTRVLVWVFVLYAAAALLLAAVGIGGVLAQTVSQRVPEIGIRLALGAPTRRVVSLVLRQVGASVAVGMLLGLGLAVAAGRVIAGLLYRVSPLDPATYATVVLALGASAAVAAIAPLRKAVRIDPIVAVRGEPPGRA
jgi:ABC-type antimicrobial peptide transport system permease subunit